MWSQTFLLVSGGTRASSLDTYLYIYILQHKCLRAQKVLLEFIILWCIQYIYQYLRRTHRNHLPLAGVAHTQTSVLTGGAKQAAVSVPADAVDQVWMVVHGDEGLACAHVPDYDQVITACRESRRWTSACTHTHTHSVKRPERFEGD